VVIPFSSVGTGTAGFWVQYTSDPNPGSGVFNDQHRIGQPAIAALTIT
jgi:hypothetical protein